MPHKHRRKEDDKTTFDLPPSTRATPLPVSIKKKDTTTKPPSRKPKSKSKGRDPDDDTPRAFARLLQFQKTGRYPSGLDDGEPRSKKRKRNDEASTTPAKPALKAPTAPDHQHPKLLPGERLSDFALRVDQALPLSLPRHTTTPATSSKIPGVKERTTKHNRKLLKLQEGWREEERRRKEKKEEELDEMEEEKEQQGLLWNGIGPKKRKKGKKKRTTGADEDDDEDPWAVLAKSREGTKQKNLQDVVQAPPKLKKVKSKFKDQNIGATGVGVDVVNVPSSVGSLRKREEMGETRRAVIDGYRKMMRKDGQAQLQQVSEIAV